MFSTTCSYLVFGAIAVAFSVFYGTKAIDIFGEPSDKKPWAWRVHQFWLNFVGSIAGWSAMWFLLRRVFAAIESSSPSSITWSDIALFFAAFIGVTGFLPFSVVSLIYGLREIASKIAGLGK